ncbi:autotransporter assembly complex protein TamA [Primorskyibacter sp. 2E107]|uniref:autotransporter assembly complex protein TamA n=1 Tax=Primorskyibacter sp. 2E107 TaxID=3403458 RepID=UPI003AF690E4
MTTLVFSLTASAAIAFEGKLRVVGGDDRIEGLMQQASLVLTAADDGTSNPQDILAAAQADYGRLLGALYDAGYFGPVVRISIDGREAANLPPLTKLPPVQRVRIDVDPGQRFEFGRAEVKPLAPGTEIPEQFTKGKAAGTATIREAASAGVEGWRAVGHAKANVTDQQITANHETAKLDVLLRITPGPLVRFGRTVVSGESVVREKRIREIAGIPKGEVFDAEILEDAATRLRRTGTFSSVTLREGDTLDANNSMDIALAVTDAKPRRFGFGAELESSEGLTLSTFWLHRNFLGGAERFRVEGEVSGISGNTDSLDYKLAVSLARPATITPETDLFIRAELEQLSEPTYFSQQASVTVGFTRQVSRQLTTEVAVGYRYSDVEDDLGKRTFSHLVLPMSLTWDRRDSTLDPKTGTYLRFEAMPYAGFGGSASGGRIYADGRAYRAFGEQQGVVLAGRLQLGSVMGSSIADTPPDLLFYSGGSGTVRGHGYQSLGITSGNDETGGRSFIGVSGELRARFTDSLGGVAFYDAGYIGANSFIDDTGGWHSGAGLGLRYQTGLGPIRLDVATPLTGDGNGVQLYLGIGQAF